VTDTFNGREMGSKELLLAILSRPGMFLSRPDMELLDHFYRGYYMTQGPSGKPLEFDLRFEAWLKKRLRCDAPSWNKIIQAAAEKRKVNPFVLLGELLGEFPDAPAETASE
jgi:hypothetical protein